MRTWRRWSLLLLFALLVGCSKQAAPVQDEADEPGALVISASGRTVRPVGKVLHLHVAEAPDSFDPARASSQSSLDLLGNLLEGLVRPGPDGRPEPAAALNWHCEAGQCTFQLRPDGRWSDGQPVTAADFVNAWVRALDPRTASPYAYRLFEIKGARALHLLDPADPDFEQWLAEAVAEFGATALDDLTLQVQIEGAASDFISRTALLPFLPVRQDSPEVHNGPFTVRRQGQRLWLVRNERYWDRDAVRLDEVHLIVEPDAGRALDQYRAGQIDLVRIPGEGFEHYQGWGLQTTALGTVFYVTPNTEHPVLRFPEARLALSLSLDRRRLAGGAYGHSAVAAAGFVPPSLSGSGGQTYRQAAGDLLAPAADVTTARRYWQGALELAKVEAVSLQLLHLPSSEGQVKALKEMWEQALPGLTVTLQPVSLQERLSMVRRGTFDLVYQAWVSDLDDPGQFLHLMMTAAPYNDARWSNAQYDGALTRFQRAASRQESLEALAQAEAILLAEAAVIPLVHPVVHDLVRHVVEGVTRHPATGALDLKRADMATLRAKSPDQADPVGGRGADYPL